MRITMVMESIQIRLPRATIQSIDTMIKAGIYGSRSDAIRDAARKLFWALQSAKTNPNAQAAPNSDYTGNRLVHQRPAARAPVDMDEINALVAYVSKQSQK